MTQQALIVSAPATTANMGPGFDTFGMALSLRNQFYITQLDGQGQPYPSDELVVREASPIQIAPERLGEPSRNLFFKTLDKLFLEAGLDARPRLRCALHLEVPFCSGLGSSATAITAALVAGNTLLGNSYSREELAQMAHQMEGHPDNAVPAMLGGCLLCDGEATYSLPWPQDWALLTMTPDYEVATKQARLSLPPHYEPSQAIFNLRKASVLTWAILKQDAEALRQALADQLHQPYRKQAIPEFDTVTQIWERLGGYGLVISGSGPTLLGIAPPEKRQALQQTVSERYPDWRIHALSLDSQGTVLL